MRRKSAKKVKGVRSGCAGYRSPGEKKSTRKAASKKFYR